MFTCSNPDCKGGPGEKPATSEDSLVFEKRIFFWTIKITNPLGLKLYNFWDVIPLSISKEGVKRILQELGILDKIPPELIQPIYIPDIGSASICFGCGQKKFKIGN